MATPAQIAANRENSKKSTGPRSPEGKAKSALNSVSYGFCASIIFLECEDPEEFYGLQHALTDEFQPATSTEQILVEKMVTNQWLSLRAVRLQSQILYVHQPLLTIPKDLGLLIRYQTTADRAFHKAHTELLKVQKERKKSEIGFVPQNAGETPIQSPAQASEDAPSASQPADYSQATPKIAEISPVGTPETIRTAA